LFAAIELDPNQSKFLAKGRHPANQTHSGAPGIVTHSAVLRIIERRTRTMPVVRESRAGTRLLLTSQLKRASDFTSAGVLLHLVPALRVGLCFVVDLHI
jgi:hypothetical protein